MAYARLGSYATAFHELRPDRRRPDTVLLREFNAYGGALITAHISGLAGIYYVSARLGGFPSLNGVPDGPGEVAKRIIACSYYALATFLGVGDPQPTGVAARVVVAGVGLQGFALLLVVLAAVLAHTLFSAPPPAPVPPPSAVEHRVPPPPTAAVEHRVPSPTVAVAGPARRTWRSVASGAVLGSAVTVIAVAVLRRRR